MKILRSNGSRLAVIGLAAILLAGWGGRSLGRSAARSEIASRGPAGQTPPPALRQERRPTPRGSTGTAGTTARLHSIWKASADPAFDFELKAETDRLLARMSSDEIAEFLRGMTLESEPQWDLYELRRDIVLDWVGSDGVAALNFLGDSELDQHLATIAFMSWAADSPDEAFAGLRDSQLSPGLQKRNENLLLNALITVAETDPERAFQEISHLAPEDSIRHLSVWAGCYGHDPAMREKLLARAAAGGRPEDLVNVRSHIMANWGSREPAEALAYLDALELTEIQRQHLEAALAKGKGRTEPHAALDDWRERNASAAELPPAIPETVSTWMLNHPNHATRWLETLPDDSARDLFYESSIRPLIHSGGFQKAAEMADAIRSPELRARAVRTLGKLWSVQSPEDAAAWRAGLSKE